MLGAGPTRRALGDGVSLLKDSINGRDDWVIEGCYGDLVEAALPYCTELVFLNPGVEACVENCRNRPWEPEKLATQSEQQAMLDALISWVRQYEIRDDEFGLARHRRFFDQFAGPKRDTTT